MYFMLCKSFYIDHCYRNVIKKKRKLKNTHTFYFQCFQGKTFHVGLSLYTELYFILIVRRRRSLLFFPDFPFHRHSKQHQTAECACACISHFYFLSTFFVYECSCFLFYSNCFSHPVWLVGDKDSLIISSSINSTNKLCHPEKFYNLHRCNHLLVQPFGINCQKSNWIWIGWTISRDQYLAIIPIAMPNHVCWKSTIQHSICEWAKPIMAYKQTFIIKKINRYRMHF